MDQDGRGPIADPASRELMKRVSSLEHLLAELTSGDESRAEAAASELARFNESAYSALEALLRSPDADHRWWAVRTLAQMREPRMDGLIRALDDPSEEVRAAAALALARHPAEEALPSLVRALSDDDPMVGTLAVNALTAIGKPAVPALLDAFPDSSQRPRIHIMRALAELRDPRAIPVMMKAMDDDSAILLYWVKEGLERLGLNMVYIKPE